MAIQFNKLLAVLRTSGDIILDLDGRAKHQIPSLNLL